MRRTVGMLLAATALAALAASIPARALMPLALALAAVTVTAWVQVSLAARRIVVIRTLQAHEAREYEPIRVDFAVTGLGRLPVTLEVRNAVGRWTPLRGAIAITVPRRGAHRLAPSELRVRDPLGIAQRHLSAGRPERLLILPAPEDDRRWAPAGGPGAGDPEPDGLQAYVAGIPIARIHWPALARGAGLHARRVVPGPYELPLVVVDTSGVLRPGAVDWAARTAAGAVLRLVRSGGCRVWLPGDRHEITVADAAAWRALHRRLALLEQAPATPAPPAAIRIEAAAATGLPALPRLPHGVEPGP